MESSNNHHHNITIGIGIESSYFHSLLQRIGTNHFRWETTMLLETSFGCTRRHLQRTQKVSQCLGVEGSSSPCQIGSSLETYIS